MEDESWPADRSYLPISTCESLDAGRGVEKTALILNSRQSRHPRGSDGWVENTAAAAAHAIGNNCMLITSYGISTYSLVTYLGAALGARMLILIPSGGRVGPRIASYLLHQFSLNTSKVRFCTVESEMNGPKGWWIRRDRTAIALSDTIFPVSVNPKGNIARLIAEHREPGAALDCRFKIPYRRSTQKLYRPIDRSQLSMSRDRPFRFITHWTRSFAGPWPDQLLYDYYAMVINSTRRYSHCALNSLRNMLHIGKIFGTKERIRGGYHVVSFTDHHPVDAIRLMRWRARFVRWNFEPYGISIDRPWAESIGIRPVTYGASDLYSKLPECEKPFFQNIGEKRGNWKPEHEWRFHGDLDLTAIPPCRMKVIVRSRKEIDEIQTLTHSEVVALTDG